MLNYFNYLNDKKEFEAKLNELKCILGYSKIYDKYGKNVVEWNEMSYITFDIKCRIDVYERWLKRLNKLTFKQKLFYEGREYMRG